MTKTQFYTLVGARIKQLRLNKQLTVQELAYRLDYERPSLSRVESGKQGINLYTLYRLTRILNVSMYDFFKGI